MYQIVFILKYRFKTLIELNFIYGPKNQTYTIRGIIGTVKMWEIKLWLLLIKNIYKILF